MVELYTIEDCVTTLFDPQKNIIIVKWINYLSRIHVREGLKAQIEAMEKYRVKAVVVDSSQAKGLPYPEDSIWFESTLYPECKRVGLELVVIICSENQISRMVSKNWTSLGEQFDLKFIEAKTMEDGIKIAESTYPFA